MGQTLPNHGSSFWEGKFGCPSIMVPTGGLRQLDCCRSVGGELCFVSLMGGSPKHACKHVLSSSGLESKFVILDASLDVIVHAVFTFSCLVGSKTRSKTCNDKSASRMEDVCLAGCLSMHSAFLFPSLQGSCLSLFFPFLEPLCGQFLPISLLIAHPHIVHKAESFESGLQLYSICRRLVVPEEDTLRKKKLRKMKPSSPQQTNAPKTPQMKRNSKSEGFVNIQEQVSRKSSSNKQPGRKMNKTTGLEEARKSMSAWTKTNATPLRTPPPPPPHHASKRKNHKANTKRKNKHK